MPINLTHERHQPTTAMGKVSLGPLGFNFFHLHKLFLMWYLKNRCLEPPAATTWPPLSAFPAFSLKQQTETLTCVWMHLRVYDRERQWFPVVSFYGFITEREEKAEMSLFLTLFRFFPWNLTELSDVKIPTWSQKHQKFIRFPQWESLWGGFPLSLWPGNQI